MSFANWVACGVLVGCGGSGAVAPDATLDDAADAPSDTLVDDPAARVDVTVTRTLDVTTDTAGLPDPTAIAIFRNAQGDVVQHGIVDAEGNAHGFLPTGGSVTVLSSVQQGAIRRSFVTHIRAVKPLDHLRVGSVRSPRQRTGAMTTMNATYAPFSTPDPGIQVLTGCGGGGQDSPPNGVFHLQFFESCLTPTFGILAVSSNNFVWQPTNTYNAGGTLALADAWQPLDLVDIAIANPPADNGGTVGTRLSLIVDGVPFESDLDSVDFTAVPTPAPLLQVRYPTGSVGAKLVTTYNHNGRLELFASLHDALPASSTIDLETLPLPELPGRARATATGVDWDQTFAGNPDIRLVEWSTEWVKGGIKHELLYSVVEPPDAPPSSTLPSLPADYADDDATLVPELLEFDPFDRPFVSYLDYDVIDGYDAARQFNARELESFEDSLVGTEHHAHRRGSQ